MQLQEQLHSAVSLSSNTREVGTQTGDSSQNKTKFLELVKTKIQKGFKRLTQTTRLGETCINLVNQEQVETKELRLSQNSPSLSRTASLNAFESQPLCKSLEEIPSGLKIQEGVNLNITGSLILKPDVLYKILNNEQDVLPEEMVQVITNKHLINTKRDKQLIENKPAAKLKTGLIDVYIAPQSEENNPVESDGVAVINDEGVFMSSYAGRALSACQESLRSPENNAVLNLVVTETGKQKIDLIKAVYNNVYRTISRAAVIAIDGNGQGVVERSFGVPNEFTKFNILTTAPRYNNLAPSALLYNDLASSGPLHKRSSGPLHRTTVPINQTNQQKGNQQRRVTPKSPGAVAALGAGAGNSFQNARNQGQGSMSTQNNPIFSQAPPPPVRQQKFLGSHHQLHKRVLLKLLLINVIKAKVNLNLTKIFQNEMKIKKTIHQR